MKDGKVCLHFVCLGIPASMLFFQDEYLIKWKDFDQSYNTWEPKENLDGCPEILAKFEEKQKSGKKYFYCFEVRFFYETFYEGKTKAIKKKEGFDRGLTADHIIGATKVGDQVMFLMKWTESDEVDMVPSQLANINCPQVVIKFYEQRLNFTSE